MLKKKTPYRCPIRTKTTDGACKEARCNIQAKAFVLAGTIIEIQLLLNQSESVASLLDVIIGSSAYANAFGQPHERRSWNESRAGSVSKI